MWTPLISEMMNSSVGSLYKSFLWVEVQNLTTARKPGPLLIIIQYSLVPMHWQMYCTQIIPRFERKLLISGVTILLSLTVFLNMVSSTMPITSDNPLLGNSSPQKRVSVCLKVQSKKYRGNMFDELWYLSFRWALIFWVFASTCNSIKKVFKGSVQPQKRGFKSGINR